MGLFLSAWLVLLCVCEKRGVLMCRALRCVCGREIYKSGRQREGERVGESLFVKEGKRVVWLLIG